VAIAGVFPGFEVGSGMSINAALPEAAEFLRNVKVESAAAAGA